MPNGASNMLTLILVLILVNFATLAALSWRVQVLAKLANKRFEAVSRAHQRGV